MTIVIKLSPTETRQTSSIHIHCRASKLNFKTVTGQALLIFLLLGATNYHFRLSIAAYSVLVVLLCMPGSGPLNILITYLMTMDRNQGSSGRVGGWGAT